VVINVVPPPQPQPAQRPEYRDIYQAPLFGPQLVQAGLPPARRAASPASTAAARRAARPAPTQQNLEFSGDRYNHSFNTSGVETAIYCDAPVASPTHRVLAAALDLSLILIAAAVLLMTFQFFGGHIVLNKRTLPFYSAIPALLALFYYSLWCLTGQDSAGMRWTSLRLVDFDGRAPDPRQRVYRMAGTCLSLCAAGLGLVWALADEERLTWHDHMSRTFPTAAHAPES
jgi:uncharacterized RDD family membrane protein YckC